MPGIWDVGEGVLDRHFAIRESGRCTMSFLGLHRVLITVENLIIPPIFLPLVAISFGLSEQLVFSYFSSSYGGEEYGGRKKK